MRQKFSVLMSLYIKEKPEYARECFESLLNQTVKADEWVIVEDGPLTPELYRLLDEYQIRYPGLIVRIPLAENHGLGVALREGILHCEYELIARMDTDDIAREDRFEKQLSMFEHNSSLDICGSHIKEFENELTNIVSSRTVPISDAAIKRYQRRRDGFNHMTVMYKKSAVIKAGNYQSCLLMEDTLLWVNMILSGAYCANVDEYLVYARVGKDMFERRGGFSYFKKYRFGRKKILDTGYISWWDYIISIIVQFIVAILGGNIRRKLYLSLLHNEKRK